MDPQAGMLAGLFERSMGLGPDWRVEDVWFEQPEGAQAELHVRVGRVPGRAVECPSCHARCGVYDTRERTWRHLDIWRYRTVVHCAVPRADCPSCGPRTVRMPWETRPNSHFAALFEAQVLVTKALRDDHLGGRRGRRGVGRARLAVALLGRRRGARRGRTTRRHARRRRRDRLQRGARATSRRSSTSTPGASWP